MAGVEGEFDVFGSRTGSLGVDLAGNRGNNVEILTFDRGNPFAADEVVVLGFVGDLGACGAGSCINHVCLRFIDWLVANSCCKPGR